MSNSISNQKSKPLQEKDSRTVLSLVIPVFNEEESVGVFVKKLKI